MKRDIKKENEIVKDIVEKINDYFKWRMLTENKRTKSDYILIFKIIMECEYYTGSHFYKDIEWVGQYGYDFTEFEDPIIGEMCKYVRSIYESLDHSSNQLKHTITVARKISEKVLKQLGR